MCIQDCHMVEWYFDKNKMPSNLQYVIPIFSNQVVDSIVCCSIVIHSVCWWCIHALHLPTWRLLLRRCLVFMRIVHPSTVNMGEPRESGTYNHQVIDIQWISLTTNYEIHGWHHHVGNVNLHFWGDFVGYLSDPHFIAQVWQKELAALFPSPSKRTNC